MHSIIIPTMREESELSKQIEEIKKTATGQYELIVTSQKSSAAVNRNFGLNSAKGDVIIMVDDDMCDFPYGWDEELVRILLEDSSATIVSARLMNKDGSLGMNMGGNYDVSKDLATVDNGYVPTACIAFRKNDLRFDETYIGSGFEDTDFCNQMMQKFPEGKHIINNRVKIVHLNEMKNQRGDYWNKNKFFYEKKWQGFVGRRPKLTLKQKKISLCMIVKNEEGNLPRCLESVKGKVDEIIIVDTGSTDKTKEVAEKYGAVIIDFPWINDFAAARNIGLRKATGDWILCLDADEELAGRREDLLEMASVPISRHVSYMMRIENVMDGGAQVEHHMARFFPNSKDVYYEGAIHEYVRSSDGVSLLSVVSDKAKIRHYGYGTQIVDKKDKTGRNEEALLKELEKDPHCAFFLYHLAVTYRVTAKHKESIETFAKWDEEVKKITDNTDLSMGYAAYLGELLTTKEYERAKEIGDRVQGRCMHNPDFCLNYGIALEHLCHYDFALAALEKAVQAKASKYPALSYDRDSMGWKAYAVMGNVWAQKGDQKKAVEMWKKGLAESPSNKDIIKALIGMSINCQDLVNAEIYLKKLIDFHPDEKIEANYVTLANIYYNTGRIDQALELFWSQPKGNSYIDQLLTTLISYQKYDQVSKIDEFLRSKAG